VVFTLTAWRFYDRNIRMNMVHGRSAQENPSSTARKNLRYDKKNQDVHKKGFLEVLKSIQGSNFFMCHVQKTCLTYIIL